MSLKVRAYCSPGAEEGTLRGSGLVTGRRDSPLRSSLAETALQTRVPKQHKPQYNTDGQLEAELI